MKKRIILPSFVLLFALNSSAFAATNDVMQQLMEKALYNIGSKVIDRIAPYAGTYIPGYQASPSYVVPTVNYTAPAAVTVPAATTTTTVNYSTNPNASINEQLIPIDR